MGDTPLSRAARRLSREGASKGGRARFAKLTPEERSQVARTAAQARWRAYRSREHLPRDRRQREAVLGELLAVCDEFLRLWRTGFDDEEAHAALARRAEAALANARESAPVRP